MLENYNLLLIISLILGILAIIFLTVLFFLVYRLRKFQKTFLSGKSGGDLEQEILGQRQKISKAESDIKKLSSAHRVLAELHQLNIQKVGVVRFNSYAEAGGNNSFALALLNAHDDGIVLSSLYGRESQRVYMKPIENGMSKIPLTEEEKQAILNSQREENNSLGGQQKS